MRLARVMLGAALVAAIVVAGVYAGLSIPPQASPCSPSSGLVHVVAAEDFWGSLASQLGGVHAHVLSIVTDPNADPHEYESNAADAQAVAEACVVIVNGAGYDSWALKLVAASATPGQSVLDVQQLLGQPVGANPHFWYSPEDVNSTVRAVYQSLVSADPADSQYFQGQYATLNQSLGVLDGKIHAIAKAYSGWRVGSTEDVFAYLAAAAGLDLVSPPAFMRAVAEGNDPTAASVQGFQAQIQSRSISVLVYNSQTVTPLTTSIEAQATQAGIPTVAISETIQPAGASFQTWMSTQVDALSGALLSQVGTG